MTRAANNHLWHENKKRNAKIRAAAAVEIYIFIVFRPNDW